MRGNKMSENKMEGGDEMSENKMSEENKIGDKKSGNVLENNMENNIEKIKTYPCGVIRDLLPLYVDEVLSAESRSIVAEHMAECAGCREYYEALGSGCDNVSCDNFASCDSEEDKIMSESLSRVKSRINKRTRRIAILAVLAVLAVGGIWQVLFNLPLKTLSPDEVQVIAGSYRLQDLPYHIADMAGDEDEGKVVISLHEYDGESSEPTYRVELPAMPDSQLNVTGDMLDAGGYVSMVSYISKYRLEPLDGGIDGDTMYIHGFKTTLLGGRGGEKTLQQLEFRPVNKIVLLDDNGGQTVLWENDQK